MREALPLVRIAGALAAAAPALKYPQNATGIAEPAALRDRRRGAAVDRERGDVLASDVLWIDARVGAATPHITCIHPGCTAPDRRRPRTL